MLCDDAEFAPRGAREKLTAFLLRSALRIAVKPVLSPNVPLSSQRRWLKRLTRLIQPRRPINIQDGIVGGVKGEWVRSTPTAANGGQSGAILYLHGGAYCVGSPATYRAATARLARTTGLPVFAADYRLAPEHQFPAAVDDAVAAYRSMSERRPVVIAGDSAGGGLAVATALAVRELQIGAPSALILFSPWVDLTTSMLSDKLSKHEVVLSCAWLSACAGHYLSGHDATTPLASPVYGDLHGLPPTLIQVGAGELLHSDAVRIYDALMNAGVTVRCEVVAGLCHGFHLHAGTLPTVDTAIERVAHFISGSIAPPVLAHAR